MMCYDFSIRINISIIMRPSFDAQDWSDQQKPWLQWHIIPNIFRNRGSRWMIPTQTMHYYRQITQNYHLYYVLFDSPDMGNFMIPEKPHRKSNQMIKLIYIFLKQVAYECNADLFICGVEWDLCQCKCRDLLTLLRQIPCLLYPRLEDAWQGLTTSLWVNSN